VEDVSIEKSPLYSQQVTNRFVLFGEVKTLAVVSFFVKWDDPLLQLSLIYS